MQTRFLFVANALENSESADAEMLFTVLCDKLNQFGIEIGKVSSLASDGAAAMPGKKSVLATRLRELNGKILGIHCICHRLASACTGSHRDVEHIADFENILRQLWKYLENSPKSVAAYLKVQEEKKSLTLSQKRKSIITKKLKKAYKTRCENQTLLTSFRRTRELFWIKELGTAKMASMTKSKGLVP